MNFFGRFLLLGLLGVVSFSGFGQVGASSPAASQTSASQATTTVKVEMPSDPVALLELAAKKNGLQNVTGPWHLKATYEMLDDNGAVKETGTFEELWVSEKAYKLSYSSPSFNQADYSNENGLFRTGSSEWPEDATAMVRRSFFPSFVTEEDLTRYRVTEKEETLGGTPLKRIAVETNTAAVGPPAEIHYLAQDAPIERIGITSQGTYQTVYNQMSVFRGAYLARDVRVSRLNKQLIHVHIDVLEWLPKVDSTSFTPPSGAVSITRRVFVSSESIATANITKTPPKYPTDAKLSQVQGTVVLQALIGTNGRIVSLQALAGPPMLQKATLDSVRQWEYRPYLIGGEPVEVETNINVVFSLSQVVSLPKNTVPALSYPHQ